MASKKVGCWHSVDESLPAKDGWYLVYAPDYKISPYSDKDSVDQVMFSKFKTKDNSWSIEKSPYGGPGCVEYWMFIKPPGKTDEIKKNFMPRKNETMVSTEIGELFARPNDSEYPGIRITFRPSKQNSEFELGLFEVKKLENGYMCIDITNKQSIVWDDGQEH